jgi:hypothetical protein
MPPIKGHFAPGGASGGGGTPSWEKSWILMRRLSSARRITKLLHGKVIWVVSIVLMAPGCQATGIHTLSRETVCAGHLQTWTLRSRIVRLVIVIPLPAQKCREILRMDRVTPCVCG